MPFFSAVDDTKLFYTVEGHGPPLICLPGGPMQASAYLGDLGGLSRHRTLVLPDLRGTGRSAVPNDPDTCGAERLVQDVEALRVHLELERTDLLGHSAGAHLALLYATTHPERVRRLVLLTPSSTLPGIAAGAEQRLAIADTRRGEPWFARAYAALHRLLHGAGMDGDLEALAPLMYGRWDRRAQEHHRLRDMQTNQHAAAVYMASSDADRAAIQCRLDNVVCPVLLHTGEIDLNSPPAAVAQLGRLLMDSRHEVQPDAGHFPWLDSPIEFTTIINQFLDAQSWHEVDARRASTGRSTPQ